MASLRIRQRKDGSTYTSVLYVLDGKQRSSSFDDYQEAVDFQTLANNNGLAYYPDWPTPSFYNTLLAQTQDLMNGASAGAIATMITIGMKIARPARRNPRP